LYNLKIYVLELERQFRTPPPSKLTAHFRPLTELRVIVGGIITVKEVRVDDEICQKKEENRAHAVKQARDQASTQ
jgi:hypothetical protein